MEGKLAMAVLIPLVGGGDRGGGGCVCVESVRVRGGRSCGGGPTDSWIFHPVDGAFAPPGEHRVQRRNGGDRRPPFSLPSRKRGQSAGGRSCGRVSVMKTSVDIWGRGSAIGRKTTQNMRNSEEMGR